VSVFVRGVLAQVGTAFANVFHRVSFPGELLESGPPDSRIYRPEEYKHRKARCGNTKLTDPRARVLRFEFK
jgi:hypothetical protein